MKLTKQLKFALRSVTVMTLAPIVYKVSDWYLLDLVGMTEGYVFAWHIVGFFVGLYAIFYDDLNE